MGWVWSPKSLVFRLVDVETSHINMVDETWAEEARVDHSGNNGR